MPGHLFTEYFLRDGIANTPEWQTTLSAPQTFDSFRDRLTELVRAFGGYNQPNEATTEQELVRPIFDLLGWADYLPQQASAGGEDIPDHLLFSDAEAKSRAAARATPGERYVDALVVQESKRSVVSLDVADPGDTVKTGTPHGQILRYLSTAEAVSDGRLRWGMLTNGAVWRLYDHRRRPRSTAYFEEDLSAAVESGDDDRLRAFYLLFRREAFTPQEGAPTTFLESALAEGRRYEERVAQDLSGVVFERVFPSLVQALWKKSGAELSDVRHAGLIFLYRLLFLLFAEDRGLLPVNDTRYEDYGLRKRVRDDIDSRMQRDDVFSDIGANYYDHLTNLFMQIDRGDASIGLPPYNGGLFAHDAAPLLAEVRLPDSVVAPIIHGLSHTGTDAEGSRFVNYRDMSVQQLGSIYERLLERQPAFAEDGRIEILPNPYLRKDSGSFYTPQELVDLIVDRTLKPMAEERLAEFETAAKRLRSDRRPRQQRLDELRKLDPAEAVLELKVLDPAMGSGHFLVTAVDFLSDYISMLVEYVPAVPEWLDGGYTSPLVERIEAIRSGIVARVKESGWTVDEGQLTDEAIIRRMVLKRCIYGVDKNPLTVELAKVSLWLHSFTVGAPLSFLDHHLRCGDSLIGMRVAGAVEELYRLGGMFVTSAIQGAENAVAGMQLIEEMSDADVAEVHESESLFQEVETSTADLRRLLDFVCGLRWRTAGMRKRAKSELESPIVDVLEQNLAYADHLLAFGPESVQFLNPGNDPDSEDEFSETWSEVRAIAVRERFLYWEAAFPGVWERWQDNRPEGGFDAVIGNPPWDRIKLQEVEWFATRSPELALAPTAAARRAGIQALREAGDPLAEEFDGAKLRADELGSLVRKSGDYPLLGGGDINLYSLFVERAMHLVKPDGIVGLLTPSGIYADKTAAKFFKSVSTMGRVGAIFDFENRRLGTGLPPFFPDVDSRFKFCVLVFGGWDRLFDQTECAFFLHDTESIDDRDRCFPLAPEDFARVNPNTGTAPVFRTRRDAEITRRIYERHPVLVDRSGDGEKKTWPVRYHRMFDMANSSHLFRTAAQLEAEGFYSVEGNCWRRGEELYLPLYEGKMVQAFDHRAASVVVNPKNLNRPAQPRITTLEEHTDVGYVPAPRFWINKNELARPPQSGWIVAHKRITAATNVRTMIAAVIPQVGCADPLPVLLPLDDHFDGRVAASIVANLNSFALDYVSRQKVQATHLDWYTVEQLPVIAPEGYERRFGDTTARELVRDHVLRLTYTAHDMKPFARDLGYDGEPFIWDPEERRHLRARLDALYFHLYGLSNEDADYVLSTFPIVRREDEAEFGSYRTRDMVLAYMNALSAGDTNTKVSV